MLSHVLKLTLLLNKILHLILSEQLNMSASPYLTLPSQAPGMQYYHNRPMQLLPFALYTIVEFTDEELTQLQLACESENDCAPGTKVQSPTQFRYIGGPLRDAFDYHVQLGTEGKFDPRYFIAATNQDWRAKGVLLVILDDDDLECNVDLFQTRAETSGLSLTNLQVGNTDWLDEKDGYEISKTGDDKTSHEGDDVESHNDGSDGGTEDRAEKSTTFTYEVPPQPPPTGFFIGVYAQSDTEGMALIHKIEPAANIKRADEFVCRLQSDSSFTSLPFEDRITQACKYHPLRT